MTFDGCVACERCLMKNHVEARNVKTNSITASPSKRKSQTRFALGRGRGDASTELLLFMRKPSMDATTLYTRGIMPRRRIIAPFVRSSSMRPLHHPITNLHSILRRAENLQDSFAAFTGLDHIGARPVQGTQWH